ncbi:MAG: hypothetical protein WBI40_05515 [Methylococcaceae bacterium]
MNKTDQLRFAVNDRIDNIDVSPSHVSLALLGEFPKDVSDFLKGSNNEIDPKKIAVSVEKGSLSIVAGGLLIASTLWADFERLNNGESLSSIDKKRAEIVELWQRKAKKDKNRRYSVINEKDGISFHVNSDSNFYRTEDVWVHVEKYLYGVVIDMGGKNTANVHIKLDDGSVEKITSTPKFLMEEKENRLYHSVSLHVTAEENLMTGKLRNYHLIDFLDYQPSYDDDEFNIMVEKGTKAWADVSDTTTWLEDLRGGNHR